uniref:Papain-like cysteine peptidase n=1 Tax=viral metagenome TaxID=1070528 RepID=A0A6C0D9V1_9ZZZZ
MYKVISFGHKCTCAGLIQHLGLKTESYPFDWLISKLDTIKDCIETNFIHFLDVNNYKPKNMEVCHLIDGRKEFLWNEDVNVNMYYETNNNTELIDTNSAYHIKLGINHHNLNSAEDYEYYKRCINRLYELFDSDLKKYYIHFNPIMGINDYENNKENLLNSFENFSDFINTKTTNTFGIYFILVKRNENDEYTNSILIKETNNFKVFLINCNHNFIDSGKIMLGVCHVEINEVIQILQNIIM